jgi:C4-type Zn-finger protein
MIIAADKFNVWTNPVPCPFCGYEIRQLVMVCKRCGAECADIIESEDGSDVLVIMEREEQEK